MNSKMKNQKNDKRIRFEENVCFRLREISNPVVIKIK